MTWTKVDDHLHSHPKILAAWSSYRASLGLHLLALSHAGAHLTDGHVSEAFVRAQLPGVAERRRAVDALVQVGLWERNGSGWVIHDYLDFNASREQVLDRRKERAASGRRGAANRWLTHGKSHDHVHAPDPTRPTPDPFS